MAVKRKKILPKQGDVFTITLRDGSMGLGQVAVQDDYWPTCAFFAARAPGVELLASVMDAALQKPLTFMVISANEIWSAYWPIIANRPVASAVHQFPRFMDGKNGSHTSRAAYDFLEAYHGLQPWDGMFDPKEHEKMLLPGIAVPPTVRYKADFAAQLAKAPTALSSPPVTEGPALVTLQIVYPGDGLPSTDLLRKRQEMERRLEAEGAGEVEGAESGAGVMEVYLRTDEVRRTLPLVEKIAAEMGFADDMLIETAPLEDEDDEEQDDA